MSEAPKLSSRKVVQKKKVEPEVPRSKIAVLHFSHIPSEYTEKEARQFFGQFGTIRKLRISRSKRTARSRGYGYIQFQLPEVAEIVAAATNDYFIGGKPIRVEVMKPEAIPKDLFKGHNKKFVDTRLFMHAKRRKAHNSKNHTGSSAEKLQQDQSKISKLADVGIDYDFERKVISKPVATPTN